MRPTLLLPLLLAAATANAQLYDNGDIVTHPSGGAGGADASALQNTSQGLTIYGYGHQAGTTNNSVADDFTVGGTCGWNITTIDFWAYQTNSGTTPTINSAYCQIWNGDPSTGTNQVVWGDLTTNRLASASFSNIYRVLEGTLTATSRPVMKVTVTVNTTLPPGTYWLHWQMGGTLSSGPWVPPVTILGQKGKAGANALQRIGATTWQALVDTVTPQDLGFKIYGTGGATWTTYGVGKAGSFGVPTWTSTNPQVGGSVTMTVSNGYAGSSPVVIIGAGQANIPVPPFGTILVNLAGSASFGMPAYDGSNTSTLTLPIPSSPSLCGGVLDLEAIHIDPGAAAAVAHTGGLEWTLGS